jgi:hypothetical protein
MDNVLIDDRRIHVDFSQSVSKLRHQQLSGWIRFILVARSSILFYFTSPLSTWQ